MCNLFKTTTNKRSATRLVFDSITLWSRIQLAIPWEKLHFIVEALTIRPSDLFLFPIQN
jgi:hypothetical protein